MYFLPVSLESCDGQSMKRRVDAIAACASGASIADVGDSERQGGRERGRGVKEYLSI